MRKKIKNICNIPQAQKKKVDFPYMLTFGDVYIWFKNELKKYEPGTVLFAEFNGKELNSSMTEDELWISYYGKTKDVVLSEREEVKRKMEEWSKEAKKEREAIEEKYNNWCIEHYGSVEAYHQHIIDELCEQANGLIPENVKDDWRNTVTKNFIRPEIKEVLYYLKKLDNIKSTPGINKAYEFEEMKQYMNNQDHSGTTARWVLSCVKHYGGELGKELFDYLKK